MPVKVRDSRLHRLTVPQYVALELSVPGLANTELLGGLIYDILPDTDEHFAAVKDVHGQLRDQLGMRVHLTGKVEIVGDTMWHPDVYVERPDVSTRMWPHISELELVVEVTNRSMQREMGMKQKLYVAGGVDAYWVVDLMTQMVFVFSRRDNYSGPRYRPLEGGRVPVEEILSFAGP